MLVCVALEYVDRTLRKNEFKRRRKGQFLAAFFFQCCRCVFWLKLCERRRESVPNDDIIQHDDCGQVGAVELEHAGAVCLFAVLSFS